MRQTTSLPVLFSTTRTRIVTLLFTLTLTAVQYAVAAYLPALRTKPSRRWGERISDGRPATSLAPLGRAGGVLHGDADDKRVLASRLLRAAAWQKRRSLRDVLAQPPERSTASSRSSPQFARDFHTPGGRHERQRKPSAQQEREFNRVRSRQSDILHTVAAHLFPSRPNATSQSSPFYPSLSLHVQLDDPSSTSATSASSFRATEYSRSAQKGRSPSEDGIRTSSRGTVQKSATGNTVSRSAAASSVRGGKGEGGDGHWKVSSETVGSSKPRTRISDRVPHQTTLSSEAEIEVHLLRQSIAALNTTSASEATAALRVLQELCHSIHNGRALETSGGIERVLDVLGSRHRRVRAAALWAVATCCQNNPPVQKAALRNGAVQTLAKIAWKDVLTVRARALFALNALLGMEEARETFENLPYATHVVIAALRDGRDFRATRRALNLVELLVGRNLDAWKTQLEAWDVPAIIERLMREHTDVDVRESAARIIAALDGKIVG